MHNCCFYEIFLANYSTNEGNTHLPVYFLPTNQNAQPKAHKCNINLISSVVSSTCIKTLFIILHFSTEPSTNQIAGIRTCDGHPGRDKYFTQLENNGSTFLAGAKANYITGFSARDS